MSGEIVDGAAVAAESSPADPSAIPQPGAQPDVQADPNANVPFHKHPRFQEIIRQNQDFRAQNGQLTTQVNQLTQAVQQLQQNRPQQGEQPNAEFVRAAEALIQIMQVNPRLKALLGLADAAPQLVKGYQGVQSLTQVQQSNLLRSGRNEISSLASKAGLPADDESVDLLEEMVAGVIRRTPGAEARFRQGDMGTVSEAFKKIQDGFVANLRRPAAASVAQTKDKVRNLPPAPRGGLPGTPAPAKIEPGKERQYEQSLHQKAVDMLSSLTG